MSKFKTVIFDFDGTIADTLSPVVEIINEHAHEFGIDGIDKFEVRKFRNLSITYLVKEFKFNVIHLPKLVSMIKRQLPKKLEKIKIFEGMSEVFTQLKDNKVQLGIVTVNNVKTVTDLLTDEQEKQFDFIFSTRSLFGKHKELNRIAKNYDLAKENTLYIGDEVRDIEAARKSGFKIAVVTWGYNSAELLEKHAADYLLHRPAQILDIVL